MSCASCGTSSSGSSFPAVCTPASRSVSVSRCEAQLDRGLGTHAVDLVMRLLDGLELVKHFVDRVAPLPPLRAPRLVLPLDRERVDDLQRMLESLLYLRPPDLRTAQQELLEGH